MMTSNYSRSGKNPNAVSIAARAPDWYTGRQYKKLAPKYDFFMKYKQDGDEVYYTEQFQKLVLDVLDPRLVFEELGENAILLCYEAKKEFCHRRLVANWLEKNLGIKVPELDSETKNCIESFSLFT
jgi:uncharacterized protein (DUF488 family)